MPVTLTLFTTARTTNYVKYYFITFNIHSIEQNGFRAIKLMFLHADYLSSFIQNIVRLFHQPYQQLDK